MPRAHAHSALAWEENNEQRLLWNVLMSEMDTEIRHSLAGRGHGSGRRTGVSRRRRSAICRAAAATACRDVCCPPAPACPPSRLCCCLSFTRCTASPGFPCMTNYSFSSLLFSLLPSWPRPRSIHPSNDDASEDDRQQPRARPGNPGCVGPGGNLPAGHHSATNLVKIK